MVDELQACTSACTNIDASRYGDRSSKTHGQMLDDCLRDLYGEVSEARKLFVCNLNPNMAYTFVITHKANTRLCDYTKEFGENYTKLVHIATRSRDGMTELDLGDIANRIDIEGLVYAERFPTW